MTSIHILTNEVIGSTGIELSKKSECPICLKKVKQRGTYYGIYCPNCNSILDESDWRGSIVRQQRERILKLSRKELSEKLGIAWKEITLSETKICTKAYMNKVEKLVRKQNCPALKEVTIEMVQEMLKERRGED